jgi:hypothetical protein
MTILRFQEFLNESVYNVGIPLYRGTSFQPERTIKRNKFIGELQDFLTQIANGTLSEITVVAEIPTQGKNAPQYIRDVMAKERARLGKKYTLDPKLTPEGGRLEKRRTETGETYSEFTGEINVFIDSEYVIQSVLREVGRDYLIGIPISYVYKVENNPSLKEYYSVKISPQYVEEVHFTPSK